MNNSPDKVSATSKESLARENKKMTRYEQLMNKSAACRDLARATKGYMQKVWNRHADDLKKIANNLTLAEASMVVADEK